MNNLDSFCLQRQITDFNVYNGCISSSGVTLYQGAPGSKFSKAKEVPKARVERRICTSFLSVQGMLTRKIFESIDSLKCHFPDFGVRFYRILMVRKRHCDISEALTIVFALQPEPALPPPPIWSIGVGGPRVRPVRAHSSYATDFKPQNKCNFKLGSAELFPNIKPMSSTSKTVLNSYD